MLRRVFASNIVNRRLLPLGHLRDSCTRDFLSSHDDVRIPFVQRLTTIYALSHFFYARVNKPLLTYVVLNKKCDNQGATS